MTAAGLRIETLSISLRGTAGPGVSGATQAIQVLSDAINSVSMFRANLGAMQNRLEFKIQNLDNQSENISASESRIRDVDMAREMTDFTRNNILFQASTAMLAQANALPQSVLQLLG
jgi:flagellin